MRQILVGALFLLACAQCAFAQVKEVQGQKVQIIVEPKTNDAKVALDSLLKEFKAPIVNAGSAKVITVPTGAETDFLARLKSKVGPTDADSLVLSQHYTSLLQPVAVESLTAEQTEVISKLQNVGTTTVLSSPPIAFAEFALSNGFGPRHGLGTDNSFLLNIDGLWMQIYDNRNRFRKRGGKTWTGTLKGEIGGSTLTLLDDGIRGFVQKSNDLYFIRPLGPNKFGIRVNAITKLARPAPFPEHEPNAPPIPMGGPMSGRSSSTGAVPTIRILFAYSKQSVAWLKNNGLMGIRDEPEVFSPYLEEHLNALVERSKANLQYEHAGSVTFTYAEDLEFDAFLKKVTDRRQNFLEEIHVARQQAKANIVAIFVSVGAGCGRARQISATAETAFVVVFLSASCLVQHTLAHEIGHLHGLVHDDHNEEPPPFPFAYGHRHDPTWRSPMAKECQVGTETRVCARLSWTNPDIPCPNSACRGDRFGSSRSHEVKVLEKSAQHMSKF